MRRGAVDRLVEQVRAVRRLEVELHRMRAVLARHGHEAGRRIDVAAGADGNEEIGSSESLVDALHLVGHLAEPDDVGAHAALFPAAGALRLQAQVVAPGMPRAA